MPRLSYKSVPGASGASGGGLGGPGRRAACAPPGCGEECALPTGALESASCRSRAVAPAAGGARSSSGAPKGDGIGKGGVSPSTGGFRKTRTASNSSLPETQRGRERKSRLMSRARSGACLASGAKTRSYPAGQQCIHRCGVADTLERRIWGSFALPALDGDATESRARLGRGGDGAVVVVVDDHRLAITLDYA